MLVRRAVRLLAALDDLAAGFAVLELDAVAGDGVRLASRLVGRIDFQADDRARLPRIFSTTSLSFMSTMSSIGPSAPWPTPTILSSGLSLPSLSAAPPGMMLWTIV